MIPSCTSATCWTRSIFMSAHVIDPQSAIEAGAAADGADTERRDAAEIPQLQRAVGRGVRRPGSVPCYREPVDDLSNIRLARLDHGRGKARLIGRIRKVLGLEAKSLTEIVELAALAEIARRLAFEVVAGEELHAGFGRPHLHDATGARIHDPRGKAERAGARLIEHVIVVVAVAVFELL